MALFVDNNGSIVNAYTCTGDNRDFIKRKLIEDHSYSETIATEISIKMKPNEYVIVYDNNGLYLIESSEKFNKHCKSYTITPEDENRNDTARIKEIISDINK